MTFITNTEVLRAAGITSSVVSTSDVDAHITHAEAYVARRMNVYFTTATYETITDEYYDGDGTDTFFVDKTPLQALSALSYSDDYGATYTSITTSKCWINSQSGKIQLKPTAETTTFPEGTKTIKVTYTNGLIPGSDHKRYMIVVAAIMTLIQQVGGTFDDVTSFQVPEMQGSLGEPWTQIRETIQRLTDERRYWDEYFKPRIFMA